MATATAQVSSALIARVLARQLAHCANTTDQTIAIRDLIWDMAREIAEDSEYTQARDGFTWSQFVRDCGVSQPWNTKRKLPSTQAVRAASVAPHSTTWRVTHDR